MKKNLQIIFIYLLLNQINLIAQEKQKWFADDIYYSPTEKEITFVTFKNITYDEENIEDYTDESCSYAMRINRFHRNYYGSSLNFNYGYFHDPFMYNGFGSNIYGMYPFYDPISMWSYNGWYMPNYAFNMYNPWYVNSFYNPYGWYNPYNFMYGFNNPYGFGSTYLIGSNTFFSPQNTYYGPRNNISSNTNSRLNELNPSRIEVRSNTDKNNNRTINNKSLINLNRNNLEDPSRFDYSNEESNSNPKKSNSSLIKSSSSKKNKGNRNNRNFSTKRNSNNRISGNSRPSIKGRRPR